MNQIQLLHYRPWQGELRSAWWSIWPIARVSLGAVLRRRLFWVLYGFSLLLFLMFFFGGFLLDWIEGQLSTGSVQFGQVDSSRLIRAVRQAIRVLNGSRDTFQFFFVYQAMMVVIVLALTGAILVGNDFVQRSLGFYLAKPIQRWHYIAGKCLAIGIIINMMTTLPALILYAQNAVGDWNYLVNPDYFWESNSGHGPAGLFLLAGILGFGLLLTVFLSIILMATAAWMRRTLPLIMVWVSVFVFLRMLVHLLVDNLKVDHGQYWRLLDMWNSMCILGFACLGYSVDQIEPTPQPEYWLAALSLVGVCSVCLMYLDWRMRRVEIVS